MTRKSAVVPLAAQPRVQSLDTVDGNGRRNEIIRTGAELICERGYHGTTMQDIAEAVGIQKSTMYHYFASKDEILFAIHRQFIGTFLVRHEVRRKVRLSASQVLLEIMADVLELMETHPGHVRAFFEHQRELPVEQQRLISEQRGQFEQLVEGVVREGIENGEFREDLDVRMTMFALFGACNFAYQWYRKDGQLRPRDVAARFWDVFMRGMEPR